MFRQYTVCFLYPAGGKPYNEKDRLAFAARGLLTALVFGAFTALVGLIASPIVAVFTGALGFVAGIEQFLRKAADEWLYHRLVCLDQGNPKCAIGVVSYSPKSGELMDFDNDQYFDLVLMPHPAVPKGAGGAFLPANSYDDKGNVADATWANHVKDHPHNDLYSDDFQAQPLLKPRPDLEKDLGYINFEDAKEGQHRVTLHCEAEGNFWVVLNNYAWVLAYLIAGALVATTGAAAAGGAAGAATGCAAGLAAFPFLGPLACIIGAIVGAAIGAAGAAAVVGGAAAAVLLPFLAFLANQGPGDVEDANVGDHSLGPISLGDKVAVLGELVYDGYHQGWHELHPLMAVVKFSGLHSVDKATWDSFYLEWDPTGNSNPPARPPGEAIDLTKDDMRAGLDSHAFRQRCDDLLATWCRMLKEAFHPDTRTHQQSESQRWTIHPSVEVCQ